MKAYYNLIHIFQKVIFLCWCFALACKLSVIFVLHDRSNISILATSIYIALHRIFWAVDVAWIIIACFTKHGGSLIY